MGIFIKLLIGICLIPLSNCLTHQKLIGGSAVGSPSEFPYMVSVERNGEPVCGGALLSNEWVITAAQCTMQSGMYTIFVGSQIRGATEGTRSNVKLRIQHPDYMVPIALERLPNDIALLQLEQLVTINGDNIVAITPTEANQIFTGQTCNFTGWGLEAAGDITTLPYVLNVAQLNVTSFPSCQATYQGEVETGSSFCAEDPAGERAPCTIDEGGPLVCLDSASSPVLAGLFSFGPNSCTSLVPSVYANLQTYRAWIRDITGV